MMEPLQEHDPRAIADYTVEGRLGEGSMGVVYEGRNAANTSVAIKVIARRFLTDDKYRERFKLEAAAARRVPRFCTAQVLDASLEGAQPFIVTEFIPGPTLGDQVSEEPLASSDVEAVAVGVAAALKAIHAVRVIHRDLKPSNIILGPYGPRVIDFGLAALVETQQRFTSSGRAVGTIAFMAPEQAEGAPPAPAADIFAWAATVVFAATGRPPIKLKDSEGANRLTPETLGLAPELCRLIAKALDPSVDERPTAIGILSTLERLSPAVLDMAVEIGSKPPLRPLPRTADEFSAAAREDIRMGRIELAVYNADRGIKIDPDSAQCWCQKGRALRKRVSEDPEQRKVDDNEGLRCLRLSYEMDSSDSYIANAYIEALAESPDINSKSLALRIGALSEHDREQHIEQLLAHGPDGVRAAYSFEPAHPRIAESYGQILLSDIEQHENDAVELRKTVAELNEAAREARYRGNGRRDEADALARAKDVSERAAQTVAQAKELVQKAYLIAPHVREIRLKYAELLLEGDTRSVVIAYRIGRDDGLLTWKFVSRALFMQPLSELPILIREFDSASEYEIRALASSLLRYVAASKPDTSEWRMRREDLVRRAFILERIAAYLAKRLPSDTESVTLRSELSEVHREAFSASDDGGVLADARRVVLAAIGAFVAYSIIVFLGAPFPYNLGTVALVVGAIAFSYVATSSRIGDRGARRRRRRAAAKQSIELDTLRPRSPLTGDLALNYDEVKMGTSPVVIDSVVEIVDDTSTES